LSGFKRTFNIEGWCKKGIADRVNSLYQFLKNEERMGRGLEDCGGIVGMPFLLIDGIDVSDFFSCTILFHQ